jgi:hypothetical protein
MSFFVDTLLFAFTPRREMMFVLCLLRLNQTSSSTSTDYCIRLPYSYSYTVVCRLLIIIAVWVFSCCGLRTKKPVRRDGTLTQKKLNQAFHVSDSACQPQSASTTSEQ